MAKIEVGFEPHPFEKTLVEQTKQDIQSRLHRARVWPVQDRFEETAPQPTNFASIPGRSRELRESQAIARHLLRKGSGGGAPASTLSATRLRSSDENLDGFADLVRHPRLGRNKL